MYLRSLVGRYDQMFLAYGVMIAVSGKLVQHRTLFQGYSVRLRYVCIGSISNIIDKVLI